MQQTRSPAVAGMFYPAGKEELHEQVVRMLSVVDVPAPAPKAIIAPHAGYIYSGPVAAEAYASLRQLHDRITTVVLLGPSHRVYFRGLAAPVADNFLTPLGSIEVDQPSIERLLQVFPFVERMPDAHIREHSLEVHLPFLQEVLDDFRLVPMVVGDALPQQVEKVIDHLWGDDSTLIVVSSDLSHYQDYTTAQAMDSRTAEAIEQLDPQALDGQHACGYLPVSGLLLSARRHQLVVKRADLRNSGDTAGSRDQVVGYGAWLFYQQGSPQQDLSDELKQALKELARDSIRYGLDHGKALPASQVRRTAEWPNYDAATFVTLKKGGQLRGCIGSLSACRPLHEDIAENAFAAAFRDPRFAPLTEDEFEQVEISVSVLTPAEPVSFTSEQDLLDKLRPYKDGLILTDAGHRGTFLPAVWEECKDPVTFLRHLKRKAGLPQDYWSPTIKVDRYETISW